MATDICANGHRTSTAINVCWRSLHINACTTLKCSIKYDTITQGRREEGPARAAEPGPVIFSGSATRLEGTFSFPRWSRVTPVNNSRQLGDVKYSEIFYTKPQISYVRFGSQNLTLLLGEFSKSSLPAVKFFEILQKIYTTFAGSFLGHLKNLSFLGHLKTYKIPLPLNKVGMSKSNKISRWFSWNWT